MSEFFAPKPISKRYFICLVNFHINSCLIKFSMCRFKQPPVLWDAEHTFNIRLTIIYSVSGWCATFISIAFILNVYISEIKSDQSLKKKKQIKTKRNVSIEWHIKIIPFFSLANHILPEVPWMLKSIFYKHFSVKMWFLSIERLNSTKN